MFYDSVLCVCVVQQLISLRKSHQAKETALQAKLQQLEKENKALRATSQIDATTSQSSIETDKTETTDENATAEKAAPSEENESTETEAATEDGATAGQNGNVQAGQNAEVC